MEFGHVLKTLRISAGISLRELSRAVDLSPTYLSLIENGKHPPPTAVRIAQIEQALGVSPGYLLSITTCFATEAAHLVEDGPEIGDFLGIAKETELAPEDFMDLTAFLMAYGREGLRQALKDSTKKPEGTCGINGKSPCDGQYVWPFLEEELIISMSEVHDKWAFLGEAAGEIADHCADIERGDLLKALLKREKASSTGIGHGVALPHACLNGAGRTIICIVRIAEGLDFDAIDGEPVYFTVFLGGPKAAGNLHLKLLARIAKLLNNKTFRHNIMLPASPCETISAFRAAEMRIP